MLRPVFTIASFFLCQGKKWHVCTFVLLCLAYQTIFPHPCNGEIRFIKEYVTLEIANNNLLVTAEYNFLNTENKPDGVVLAYPFMGMFPRKVRVEYKKGDKYSKIRFKKIDNEMSISFPIFLESNSELFVSVIYSQELKNNRAGYILTSTKEWKRGLMEARFEIAVSKNLKDVNINYQTNECSETPDYIVYCFKRYDFMPEKNLLISWTGE